MTTIKAIDGQRKDVKEIFAKHGIDAKVKFPSKADLKDEIIVPMFLSLDDQNRTVLTYEPGTANVELYFDAEFRQVVIVAKEKKRTVTETFKFSGWAITVLAGDSVDKRDKKFRENCKDRAERGNFFPTFFPVDDVDYVLDEIKSIVPGTSRGDYTAEVTVTATIPASTVCLLAGWDEHAMFISALPRTVNSVKNAHEALRPSGVPKDAERQGEFFFVPVSQKKSQELDAAWCEMDYTESDTLGDYWEDSNHKVAMSIRPNGNSGEQYVAGMVWDVSGRHDPVWLDGWYKVVTNAEIAPPENMEGGKWD